MKKKLLLIISMFLFLVNVKTLTFNVNIINIGGTYNSNLDENDKVFNK